MEDSNKDQCTLEDVVYPQRLLDRKSNRINDGF